MFNKVLVPIDLGESDFSQQALKLAIREVVDNHAELHLITVVAGYGNPIVAGYFSEDDHHDAVKKVAAQLKQFAHDNVLANENVPADAKVVLKVYEGSPAENILHHIKHEGIDLVLLAAHHRSRLDEFLLGSVSSRVAERARCSVMLLKS
ncbi:universal stress protein [Oceanospirillum maris]|uniref:universal stress protein n=1 Tax=Oceanospirillum maris TaxID=64977 RepID=UPI0003FFA565|nr:universal stress protein [Oceanospirillum maris]